MRGSAAGGSSPSASTIILTRATAAAVCCVKALTSSGHTQPGRSSGATSGKGSKSVLSKACWQTSETALKASEMARCLNLRRLSYVTLSPLRVSITSEYTSCRSSRYTSRKRNRVLSDISDSRVGLSFVISKSSSSPCGESEGGAAPCRSPPSVAATSAAGGVGGDGTGGAEPSVSAHRAQRHAVGSALRGGRRRDRRQRDWMRRRGARWTGGVEGGGARGQRGTVGTPSLASWTLRTGLVGHSPPIKVAISCASAFGSLDFQFSSASGPRSSSFLTRPIAETGESVG
mmetsp:Transcript_4835/g.15696  ORF Transcript_4835/g.15696 Transcript_4835/m.15696 type:complete len:288 (+) Transcript_4835:367-1230(+)